MALFVSHMFSHCGVRFPVLCEYNTEVRIGVTVIHKQIFGDKRVIVIGATINNDEFSFTRI